METIYSKRYDMASFWTEHEQATIESPSPTDNSKEIHNPLSKIEYRPVEHRINTGKQIIRFVKNFAEICKTDVDILQDHMQIIFILHCKNMLWSGTLKKDIEHLIHCCNEMDIQVEKDSIYDYSISLHYITHDIYFENEEKIPAEDL